MLKIFAGNLSIFDFFNFQSSVTGFCPPFPHIFSFLRLIFVHSRDILNRI